MSRYYNSADRAIDTLTAQETPIFKLGGLDLVFKIRLAVRLQHNLGLHS